MNIDSDLKDLILNLKRCPREVAANDSFMIKTILDFRRKTPQSVQQRVLRSNDRYFGNGDPTVQKHIDTMHGQSSEHLQELLSAYEIRQNEEAFRKMLKFVGL